MKLLYIKEGSLSVVYFETFTFPLRVLKLTFTFAMSFIKCRSCFMNYIDMTLCDVKIHYDSFESGWTLLTL